MREHRGAHPRLGAVDVVPFVPIQGVEMEEAVQIALSLERNWEEEEFLSSFMRRQPPARREKISFDSKGRV